MMNPSFTQMLLQRTEVFNKCLITQAALSINPQQVMPSNQAYSLNLEGLFDKSDKVEGLLKFLPENMIR